MITPHHFGSRLAFGADEHLFITLCERGERDRAQDLSDPGMERPILEWTPSIAPSGLTFYSGSVFPAWKGNLFAGALKFEQIRRLEIYNGRISRQKILLESRIGRIRDIRQGPDGNLWLLTDEKNGGLYRIEPDF